MQLLKQLRLALPIVLIAQLVFAMSAVAFLPGQSLLPAGNYHITTLSADYFVCCGQDQAHPFLSVSVTDTTTVANPLIGPATTTHETDVFLQASAGPNPFFGGGCFIAGGASDFTITGLSSAVLKTSFDPATSLPCQNFPVSLPAFSLSVAWTGMSPVGTTRKTSLYSCAGYNAQVETLNSNDPATDTATMSLFGTDPIPGESGGLGSNDQRWEAQGVAQDACSPEGLGGGGKGAGPGPTGNGGFELAIQNAGANIPFGFVSLATVSRVTRPTGIPPTTFKDTELTVVSFGFPFFEYCYVLQSPNTFSFGSGLSSAFVNASIDQNTPACTDFPNSPFVPFTANLTWTASGPLASIQNTAISDCGGFHQVLLSTAATNPAGATGNVSILGDISSPQSSINSSDHRFQDMGTAPQGCILRP